MNILARSGAVRRRVAVACGVLASLFVCGSAAAQFGPIIDLPPGLPTVTLAPPAGYPPTVAPTAAGPYYAPPAWSQTLAPNARFVVLSNFNSDAVLDRATGLVWARQGVTEVNSPGAENACMDMVIGSRMGWRLPAISELLSLVDGSLPISTGTPRLPVGHPFLLPTTLDGFFYFYWTTEIAPSDDEPVRLAVEVTVGGTNVFRLGDFARELGVLCVRGAKRER